MRNKLNMNMDDATQDNPSENGHRRDARGGRPGGGVAAKDLLGILATIFLQPHIIATS